MEKEKIADFKIIWFRVPQKLLRKLFYSVDQIDHKTYLKMRYYRRVLEKIITRCNHLISLIDRIILRSRNYQLQKI
jgi:hypothetical protein